MKSTCPYCGVGCGVDITIDDELNVSVEGDASHPANFGRLCSKGSALAETLTDKDRLLHPAINGKRVDWDQATDHIAERLSNTISEHGRDSVAFYVSGQLLTEDYYVVNKFVKGWLGNANIDTNSRLCMASSVVGHKRAFGSDTVPGCYEDLEAADLIVLVGSNLAWCHPVLFQRILAEKERRPDLYLVVIDPRRTMTADAADLHLPIQPDSDAALFNGLLLHLSENESLDYEHVIEHVTGLEAALVSAQPWSVENVADICGVDSSLITQFFERFSNTEKTVSVYSQGVNQSAAGTDKVNAIINCHLASGRIGKLGMGPFSITGQPNAMGGREVGGLATMLAGHMELLNAEHRNIVQSFWQSPHIADAPGPCAVDLFSAVADGSIKAIWIMGTNPVDSLPVADSIKAALDNCPLVIVSDVAAATDTMMHADVLLPAQAWGEKDGTVTNSERCISRQRHIKLLAGEAKPDWWALSMVARKMGFTDAFNYETPADIFREHAALSGTDNAGTRDFDISACAGLSNADYDNLKPFYWPWINGNAPTSPIRFFANGKFFTPDNRAKMLPISVDPALCSRTNEEYPLVLNTGRNRDQWHTMTRTGYSVRLSKHLAEPYITIHPQDAIKHGIADADLVCVSSCESTVVVRALLSDRQRTGQVFIPLHWSDQFASQARVDSLFTAVVDPYSKQPASKYQAVSIKRFDAISYVYGIMQTKPDKGVLDKLSYWAIAPVDHGWQIEAASSLSTTATVELLQPQTKETEVSTFESLSFKSSTDTRQSSAVFSELALISVVFVDTKPVEASRSWVQEAVSSASNERSTRWQLLAGRPCSMQLDKGAIVCSCFSVGANEIKEAVVSKGCNDVQSVGQCLQAGTNCGSCRSEIQSIVHQHKPVDLPALA